MDVVARTENKREIIKFVYFFALFARNLVASKIEFSNLTERRGILGIDTIFSRSWN